MECISAEDVFRQTVARGTRVSLSTVYRVIHELTGRGLLLREWSPARKALYCTKPDRFNTKPLRLVCPSSWRAVVLDDAALYESLLAATRCHGIELYGQILSIQVSMLNEVLETRFARRPSARAHPIVLRA